MKTPFSLRIVIADGDPDGLRIVDMTKRIGQAPVFPRALPQVEARPELVQTGSYSPLSLVNFGIVHLLAFLTV